MKSQIYKSIKFLLLLVLILPLSPILPVQAGTPITTPEPNAPNPTGSIYLPFVNNSTTNLPPNPTPPPNHTVYYISPTGTDSATGLTEAQAWATFNHAWQYLFPGDTLILLDGVYYQSLNPNVRNGQPGAPITIRAKNDGKAIIDGQYKRLPVKLGDTWPGPVGDYFVIEGIIARNSSGSVYTITKGSYNILRRISGYNANTDENSHIFQIWANNNLIEDCVASGSGRKMILIFASTNSYGQNNTVRRCFASYRDWDGRDWHDEWPWNENFEVYSGDHNTFENDIAYGYFANAGFSLLAQGGGDDNIGNKILGSVAIMGGSDFEGTPIKPGNIRPQPSQYSLIKNLTEPCHRTGIYIGHGSDSIFQNDLIQDVLSWGNDSVGLCVAESPQMINDVMNRVTLTNNGLDLAAYNRSIDARSDDLSGLNITNSRIDVIKGSSGQMTDSPTLTGEGARLQYRYVDGVLKDGSNGSAAQPLWPWPMEDRIRKELGISVTNLISKVTNQAQLGHPVPPMSDTSNIYPSSYLLTSPVSIPFGNVSLGNSAIQTVTLKNPGNTSLTVTAYQFDSQGSDRFSIVSGGTCPQLPFTLAPSQSCTVKVAFTPQDYQAKTTYLSFTSPGAAPYPKPPRIYLSGLGYGSASPISLPTKLQAEAYTASSGDFQVKPTMDDGGSGKISDITGGSWLEYPVNIAQAGNYSLTARVASVYPDSSTHFSLALDGITIATFYPVNTGGWDTFTDLTISNIALSVGSHTLRLNLATGSFDLNYINISIP